MSTEQALRERSGSRCELCGGSEGLSVYPVPPAPNDSAEQSIVVCSTCRDPLEDPDRVDPEHWRCLGESMWTPVPAVQVVAWRMLVRLEGYPWAESLLDMLYLDDETLDWARAGSEDGADAPEAHRDCNGALLEAGDTVTLVKDLDVKGANLTAKRGTAVRRISLVPDNPEQIEGRVDGQPIVILTRFVKKSN